MLQSEGCIPYTYLVDGEQVNISKDLKEVREGAMSQGRALLAVGTAYIKVLRKQCARRAKRLSS